MSTRRSLARDRRFPTLLDRLVGQPLQSTAARQSAFLADLESLLNARADRFVDARGESLLAARSSDLARIARRRRTVGSSVVNFGIPDLCGRVITPADKDELESDVRTALIRFEPRLLPRTLDVDVRFDEETGSIGFAIRAEVLSLDQVEDRLFLVVNVDLATGRCSLDPEARDEAHG